jgi:cell division protein YceG involved in septum cleavage
MVAQGEERRKHVRIFLPGGQVRLVSGMLLALVGKVIDISVGGVKFIGNTGFSAGDDIDLEVTLPSGMKFKCIARIAHYENIPNNEQQIIYGAQFINLSLNERLELGEYVMKKRAEQDDLLHQELE